MRKLSPCIWMNGTAAEAAELYKSVFKKVKILQTANYDEAFSGFSGMPAGSLMLVTMNIEGLEVMLLNGGPLFKPNPSMSFMISCKTSKEVDTLYSKLSKSGKVMMELGEYPFSKRYAWIEDKFGVSWQIMQGKLIQKITPCILFVGKQNGRASEAIKHYTSVFKGKTEMIAKYEKGELDTPGHIKFGLINIKGTYVVLMESGADHKFQFNEGNSLIIYCKTQKEVDHFWNKLTADGGQESMCGWLKDKFGVNWQVTPTVLDKLMMSKQMKNRTRMNLAMGQMRKLDIKILLDAYNGKTKIVKKGKKVNLKNK